MRPTISKLLVLFTVAFPCLVTAHQLTGTVLDPDGEPLADASVWVSQERNVRKVVSDAQGAFSVDGLGPAPISIVALKDGYSIGGKRWRGMVDDDSTSIRLGTPGDLEIRIISHEHKPVHGARIRSMVVSDKVHVSVNDLVEHGFPSIRTDEDGNMQFPFLPKDGYLSFVVSHRDFADSAVAYLPVGAKKQAITLFPGVTLRGRITNENRQGVPGARVSVFEMRKTARRVAAEAKADSEGFYHLNVAPGTYYLAAKHNEYVTPPPQRIKVSSNNSQNTQGVDVTLAPPRYIKGSVLFPDKKPAPGVTVNYYFYESFFVETLSQVDGTFSLAVPAGKGKLEIEAPEGFLVAGQSELEIVIDKAAVVEIEDPVMLKPLPAIRGIVTLPDGKPAQGVLVSSSQISPELWDITDINGAFEIKLSKIGENEKLSLRAEHGKRFLRSDVEADIEALKPLEVKLRSFDPDSGEHPKYGNVFNLDKSKFEDKDVNVSSLHLNDLSLMVGKPAPEIQCETWLNCEPLTLEECRDKVIVLTLWGSFDESSNSRMEELRKYVELFQDVDDVVFITVHDRGKDLDDVRYFVRRHKITFPVAYDKDPFLTFDLYNTNIIPQTVLIDKEGNLRYYDVEGRLLELIKVLRRER